jgi:hypothetical protein
MSICACCKRMFQVFHVFQTYVSSGCCIYMNVASVCFKCFIRMLQVFHLDVAKLDLDAAYVCNGSSVFWCLQVFSNICCKCFSCFRRMFQVFHVNVAKVELCCNETHLLQLLGHCRWSPCGRLRPANASTTRIHNGASDCRAGYRASSARYGSTRYSSAHYTNEPED